MSSKERTIIAFFGRRNSGKSSLVNAFTNQSMSIVSDVAGTTTDPVTKTMELLPIGPVTVIDTPGMDDVGELGEMRVKRTTEILRKTDIAILVVDIGKGVCETEKQLVAEFRQRRLPFVIAFNKSDLFSGEDYSRYLEYLDAKQEKHLAVSAWTKDNVEELKNRVGDLGSKREKLIVADILNPKDLVILVLPIDESAPKGRLILPQQQVLRELLDTHCKIMCTQVEELESVFFSLDEKPALVITDSQVFEAVDKIVPLSVRLTSFSILFARFKGDLPGLVGGARKLGELKDGDTILIAEGCTHHRQCNDIGSVKLPKWIRKYSGKNLHFEYSSGNEFPENLQDYALVVHCGGCMLNTKEMQFRMGHAKSENREMVNFGIAIAKMHGILDRAVLPFKEEVESYVDCRQLEGL